MPYAKYEVMATSATVNNKLEIYYVACYFIKNAKYAHVSK
jgi:hypothetical protein